MQLSRQQPRIGLLGVALLEIMAAALSATPAKAQIVRIRPGLGIQVNTPYANIHVAPRYGLGQAYGFPRRRRWGRLRDLGRTPDPDSGGQPSLALEPRPENRGSQRRSRLPRPDLATSSAPHQGSPQPVVTTPSARSEPTSDLPTGDTRGFPTANDLAKLDNPMLMDALLDLSNRLDARLGQFKTGSGWKHYLRLPAEVLSPNGKQELLQIDQAAMHETLERFELVASNPDFHIIAAQPSFMAALTALQEVVTRRDHTNRTSPNTSNAQEVLPTPEPAEKHPAPVGEHSILKR